MENFIESNQTVGYISNINLELNTVKIFCYKTESEPLYDLHNNNYNFHVNTFIKSYSGFYKIIYKVISASIIRTKDWKNPIYKEIEAKVAGYFKDKIFFKSLITFPIILNSLVFITDNNENNSIYSFNKNNIKNIQLGKNLSNEFYSVEVNFNSLFASHIGIFGNTGSGKSNTLAKIYNLFIFKILNNKNKNELIYNIFILDFNNEYKNSIIDNQDHDLKKFIKKNIVLSTRHSKNKNNFNLINLDLSDLNSDIICSLLNATEKTQSPIVKRAWKDFYSFLEKKYEEDLLTNYEDILNKICKEEKEKIIESLSRNCYNRNVNMFYSLKNFLINELIFKYKKDEKDRENYNFEAKLNEIKIYKGEHSYGTGSWRIGDVESVNSNDNITKVKNLIHNLLLDFELEFKTIFDVFWLKLFYYIETSDFNSEWLMPLFSRAKNIKKDFDKIFCTSFKNKFNFNKESFAQENIFNLNECNTLYIISFENVNENMQNVVTSFISEILFKKMDSLKSKLNKEKDQKKVYSMLVIDEAHRVLLKQNEQNESNKLSSITALDKLIREGRKFNLFLTLSSQRPADIYLPVLSQLNNFFLHRLINDEDLKIIKTANSYIGYSEISKLSSLQSGQCLVSGTAFNTPEFLQIEQLTENLKPDSDTIELI